MIPLTLSTIEIKDMSQRTLSILGGKGSGKTNTLKMLAYTLSKTDTPVYIFDSLNVIRIEGFKKVIITKKFLDRGADLGKLFNQIKDKAVIISFDDMLQSEISSFANGFFGTWKPHKSIICIDEIHEYTPQKSGSYAPEVERAVRHWRNYDIGFILTSQRPASVEKNVLALTDYAIIYRTTWSNDVEAIKELLKNILTPEYLEFALRRLQTFEFLNGYSINFLPENKIKGDNKHEQKEIL